MKGRKKIWRKTFFKRVKRELEWKRKKETERKKKERERSKLPRPLICREEEEEEEEKKNLPLTKNAPTGLLYWNLHGSSSRDLALYGRTKFKKKNVFNEKLLKPLLFNTANASHKSSCRRHTFLQSACDKLVYIRQHRFIPAENCIAERRYI
jgi:hypothetical protein